MTKGIFHFADSEGRPAPDFCPQDENWSNTYKWVLNLPSLQRLLEQNKDSKAVFLCGRGNILSWARKLHMQVDKTQTVAV